MKCLADENVYAVSLNLLAGKLRITHSRSMFRSRKIVLISEAFQLIYVDSKLAVNINSFE